MIIKQIPAYAFISFALIFATTTVRAQAKDDATRPTVIWINSWYGPYHSGIGVAGRYGIGGIGATVFSFTGDSATSSKSTKTVLRPGQIGINVDAFMILDFSSWVAGYASIGVVARLDTFRTKWAGENYSSHEAASAGGGFQISLASHLMLGIGYNLIWDVQHSPDYAPIHCLVGQVGYRL